MRMTGQVTGWLVLGSSSGAMLVPLIIGQFFQSIGPYVLMFVTTMILLAAVAVLTVVIRNSEPIVNRALAHT